MEPPSTFGVQVRWSLQVATSHGKPSPTAAAIWVVQGSPGSSIPGQVRDSGTLYKEPAGFMGASGLIRYVGVYNDYIGVASESTLGAPHSARLMIRLRSIG